MPSIRPKRMRTRIYIDGVPSWSANVPSNGATGPAHIRGSMVVGLSSGTPIRDRLTANQAKLDARPVRNGRPRIYATDEERLAARRKTWRESAAARRAKVDAA